MTWLNNKSILNSRRTTRSSKPEYIVERWCMLGPKIESRVESRRGMTSVDTVARKRNPVAHI